MPGFAGPQLVQPCVRTVGFAWSRKVQAAQAVEVTALTAHRGPRDGA
jgi:hypothetical protein